MGSVGILNVGAGDTKLTFDRSNPAECIRAARIVTDMIKRGYVLLVEITNDDGSKIFQRAKRFDDKTYEYIIADFDPLVAQQVDAEEHSIQLAPGADTDDAKQSAEASASAVAPPHQKTTGSRKNKERKISATGTRAVAVGRMAGG